MDGTRILIYLDRMLCNFETKLSVEALQHICPQLSSESSQKGAVMERQAPILELAGIKAGFCLAFFRPVTINHCHLSLLEEVLNHILNIIYPAVYSSRNL